MDWEEGKVRRTSAGDVVQFFQCVFLLALPPRRTWQIANLHGETLEGIRDASLFS